MFVDMQSPSSTQDRKSVNFWKIFDLDIPPHDSLEIIEKSCEIRIGDVMAAAVWYIFGHRMDGLWFGK
jgi:hypothetical protein